MKCPRCKRELVHSDIENHQIETCMSCHGMWLDRNQLNSFFPDTIGDIELCSIDENLHKDEYSIIECRKCKDIKMKKINLLDYSEIILDYCPQCRGFWLDKDELGKIKMYIKKIEEGSHEVKYHSAYNLLIKLSEISYSIFH